MASSASFSKCFVTRREGLIYIPLIIYSQTKTCGTQLGQFRELGIGRMLGVEKYVANSTFCFPKQVCIKDDSRYWPGNFDWNVK